MDAHEPKQQQPNAHERVASDLDEIRRAGVAVQRDLETLVGAIRRERGELTRRIQERPILALGAAFGVGFVLGGGLASRIGGWLLVSGARLVAAQAMQRITSQLVEDPEGDLG